MEELVTKLDRTLMGAFDSDHLRDIVLPAANLRHVQRHPVDDPRTMQLQQLMPRSL
ncbi:hypothetical protein [Pseudomonas sp. JBR1]|uniref:hypothetical protein n=1 Tax=Pseudomonas sp. JBR1 TaxID=3020907 RepID=UPI0023055E79|nr:hypothetical protein [Pseudomonas sp. JBR1]WCE09059.1 hypothetical protein PJ259_02085 [Pseudomonas sp. JBR1]